MITDEEIQEHDNTCQEAKRKTPSKGPWNDEVNRKNWQHNGLDCMILRHPRALHLCGYVGVPKGHPLHGKGYSELYDKDIDLEVHGGLTYSEGCQGHICHQKEGNDNTWWFGFDCAHAGDRSPGYQYDENVSTYERYRDIQYVETETNRLADQLAVMVN